MEEYLNASEEIKKLKKRILDLEEEKEDLEDNLNEKIKTERLLPLRKQHRFQRIFPFYFYRIFYLYRLSAICAISFAAA